MQYDSQAEVMSAPRGFGAPQAHAGSGHAGSSGRYQPDIPRPRAEMRDDDIRQSPRPRPGI
ncbi:MAG: hypothetical protein ACHQJ6_00770 [Candidatus Berkiellales bacterium]